MCGIVGIANFSESCSRSALTQMRQSLHHRGPDDEGEHWPIGGSLGLGHQRLSVIDLSAAGRQPMTDGDRLSLTYNGELYNYKALRDELIRKGHSFHTETDSEVILRSYREWGTKCVDRFDGMFAIAIFDSDMRSVFLARDRAGEKPLYYWHDNRQFLFASEIKALLASQQIDAVCDIEAFVHYLTYGYAPSAGCMLRGIKKVPPGHALLFQLETGELRQWCYWQLPEGSSSHGGGVDDYVDRLQQLLRNSVKERLVADVPVGILLSGGLDSSLITGAAAEAAAGPVRTFTVSFPGAGSFDEREHARLIARHFGTDHSELSADAADIELLGDMARQFDEPVGDPSAIPTYLVSKEIRRNATVALGGDGGDELFGGYKHYSYLHYQTIIRRWLPAPVRKLVADSAARLLPAGATARNQLIALEGGLDDAFASSNVHFDKVLRQRLLSPVLKSDMPTICSAQERRRSAYDPRLSAIQNATRMDFGGYMSEDILVKVDRASMLTSLEVRSPFLAKDIIDFAYGEVPDDLRVRGRQKKILLNHLARRTFPPDFDYNRKQGFSVPETWFSGRSAQYIEEVLRGIDHRFLDAAAVNDVIAQQRKGSSNMKRIFSLCMFELWRREYGVALPM